MGLIPQRQHCKKKKKKAFHNICISVLEDAEQSRCCYTGEETIVLPPDKQHQVKLRAALTTSTQLKLNHMKASVLVMQEVHKHPSLDAEPSGFFHLHQNIACLYHLVLIVFVCLFVREVFLSPSHLSAPLVFLHSCTSDLTFPLYLF